MEQEIQQPMGNKQPQNKYQGQKGSQNVQQTQQQKQSQKIKDELFNRYWTIIDQRLDQSQNSTKKAYYKDLLQRSKSDHKLDRALGAIYGALIGDALGAYCQFKSSLSQKTVDEAMEMRGGGTFGLYPGQFTDDTELASHLLTALVSIDITKPLQKQTHRLTCKCAMEYVLWRHSAPFDVGTTTRTGIETIQHDKYWKAIQQYVKSGKETQPQFFEQMYEWTYNKNGSSTSNGSLMRISPFASFFAVLGQNPLNYEQFIKNQIRLTHSNRQLGVAGFCWVNLLTTIINRIGNSTQEFHQILTNCADKKKFSPIQQWIQQAYKPRQSAMAAVPNMGFAKIAFSYGLRVLVYLAQGRQTRFDSTMYREWISWIIKRAGDTDTNAAIAGGLIGSVIGFWNLPEEYVATTLKTVTDGRKIEIHDPKGPLQIVSRQFNNPHRHRKYQPFNVLLHALQLLEKGQLYQKKRGTEL